MTKTLTEQWREGTLPDGNYYFKLKDGTILSGCQAITDGVFRCEYMDFHKRVKEVLAPVPSYDEWKQAKENLDKNGTWYTERSYKLLEKQLEIATKALKKLKRPEKDYLDYIIDKDGNKIDLRSSKIAAKALKEMEGVK